MRIMEGWPLRRRRRNVYFKQKEIPVILHVVLISNLLLNGSSPYLCSLQLSTFTPFPFFPFRSSFGRKSGGVLHVPSVPPWILCWQEPCPQNGALHCVSAATRPLSSSQLTNSPSWEIVTRNHAAVSREIRWKGQQRKDFETRDEHNKCWR